jgi:hypothetical protein
MTFGRAGFLSSRWGVTKCNTAPASFDWTVTNDIEIIDTTSCCKVLVGPISNAARNVLLTSSVRRSGFRSKQKWSSQFLQEQNVQPAEEHGPGRDRVLQGQDDEGRMGGFRAQHRLSHAAETLHGYQTTFGIPETINSSG